MYLKAIKAHGFKSFADKTLIELDNQITGIVGPNGSGKSNVVDAVRWVLGEQSVKSLRGDGNMTEVIFSGSKSRNFSSVASVTLILDNLDHYLPLDFTEVAIKRRLYKDGTNEYFLNNEKVRLKDITDILLDSGIAKESFNIISQGKIEEILSDKPDERRIIFEEASGVLKYKKRKEEALRKLDRTNSNMNRVNDIINELEVQVEPLKAQKESALEYNKINDELEEIEVALITNDITNLNFEYQNNKEKIDILNDEISLIATANSTGEVKILEYKNKISLLNEEIKDKQISLMKLITEVEQINGQKKIILERQKYSVTDIKYHDNLIVLKEKEFKIQNEIKQLESNILILKQTSMELEEKKSLENKKFEELKKERLAFENNLKEFLRTEQNLKVKIDSLKYSIDSNASLPYAVKKVLDNPKLRGIKDVIGNLFQVDEKYSLAISSALGMASTNIVVDNETCAKEAINYLKDNNVGRVTFFPLNVIKPKGVDFETNSLLMEGYIGLASSLVFYDKIYSPIILNQLGNVLVVDNIDHANIIAKKINYHYRIVTLDGELLHVGGSLTGGKNNNRNIILEKYELEKLIKELDNIVLKVGIIEEKINAIDMDLRAYEDRIYLINKNKIDNEVRIDMDNQSLSILNEDLKNISLELLGTNSLLSKQLVDEEETILKQYYFAKNAQTNLETDLNNLINKKDELNNDLEEYELSLKKENSLFNEKNNVLKQLEISVNRLDVKLDNLLNILNETYNLTYEAATSKYKLEIPDNIARNQVNNLKKRLKEIGSVNLGSIEEYDRVNTRYEFLLGQRDDLTKATNTLLEIIDEMDKVMEQEFLKTFKIIQENFSQTFKELFKGGQASLKLTNPERILETGIDIIASPPGKKLSTISLLSGGEKTFTAISLLFAILKSKPVPFCILDEVEAALDDSNVDSFGKYVRSLKDKTQFIIITHKKKTMEYVDTLYGITMQESGVSKLVSVKLEELK
ncbi:MAG: AAA family ATPase [Bacilli bacterium]